MIRNAIVVMFDSWQFNYTGCATGAMPVSAVAEYAAQRSLDGEAQWTCTPASKIDLPEGDELYFRKDDPFQLNNVIGKNKEIAEGLLKKLRLYMQDLD